MKKDSGYIISTVAQLVGVPAYTIRYWEKEFSPFLNPARPNGGHRRYGSYEVELLKRIKVMLWEEKYSIAGARQKLQSRLIETISSGQDNNVVRYSRTDLEKRTVFAA